MTNSQSYPGPMSCHKKKKEYKVVRNYCGRKDYTVIHNPKRGTLTKKEARRKAHRLNASYDACSI